MKSDDKKSTGRKGRTQPPGCSGPVRTLAVFVAIAALAAAGVALLSNGRSDRGEDIPAGQVPAADRAIASQVVVLQPSATPSPAPITPPPCVAPVDWVTHVVEAGNTLYSLSQRYGTDVETLRSVNCLEGDNILIGQELRVPGPQATPAPAVLDSATSQAVPGAGNQSASGNGSQPRPTIDLKEGFPERFINIVLLGSDKRENDATWRTDTIIIATVDSEYKLVRLLSLPRDLWVKIPGHGHDRINTADLWGELREEGGGPDLVKQTIYENLGIPIHYYVRVDFDGFMKIIDAVGGVNVDVECPLTDIEILPGLQHMDGETALLYARSRITTNDFDRNRRQRKLLMALWEKGLSMDIIPRLPTLWVAMGDAFETDLPLNQAIGLAYLGLQLRPNQILSQSIGPWQVQNWISPDGAAVLLPLQDEIEALLSRFYSPPDLEFLEQISQTRVEVINGSQLPQAGELVANGLRWTGFQVTSVSPAGSQYHAQTQVVVYNAAEDVAEAVALLLDAPRSAIVYQSDPSQPVDIQVVLGADYDPCAAQ
jgi:LCP family protein required for cell wall assembly